ncbi:MAG: DUF115 domain-containing protein [Gallionellaceae bacterium]|nr:DUF115 domain-containing protein [Gallionellaceae bacterium]
MSDVVDEIAQKKAEEAAKAAPVDNDPGMRVADPQHHANPVYQGIDYFALDFIKRREQTLAAIAEIRSREPPEPETTVEMLEKDVKADVTASNAKYAGGALKREILNSYYNHPLILHDFITGRGRNLDGAQPGSRGPALIIGSGPTLDDAHDLVRGWNGGLFCSSSQAVTMLALGKRDFQCVVVDVKTLSNEFMPLDAFDGKGVTMITHPGMEPEVIQCWRWGKLYFRIIVHNMQHYIEALPIAYPMIRTTLYVYGCVAASQIMIAKLMGYNPLFLIGCDFGYPDDRARFSGFHWEGGAWVRDPPSGPPRYTLHPKVTYRNGCVSDHFQSYYKQTFMNSWRLTLADMWKVGSKGGLYEVPSIDPAYLLETQGNIPSDRYILSNKDKQDICERYLLQFGTYAFEFPNGQVEFVLFGDEEKELPLYVKAMNDAFLAQKIPGVLILGEEQGRLKYLRDDEAWARKEQRWRWETMLPQSPMATTPAKSSESASGSIETTGQISSTPS